MQISANMFTDPTMRPGLQQYYEAKKASAVEALKARENNPLPAEVSMKGADGQVLTAKVIPISAEQMEKAFVNFDVWLELQQRLGDSSGTRLEMAQRQLDAIAQNNPDSPSNVRATFSNDGTMLAYIHATGGVVMSNGSERYLQPVLDKVNGMNLTGQSQVDFLTREITKALSEKYDNLKTVSYDNQTMSTQRQFSNQWHKGFDIDQHYADALKEARASYDEAQSWHKQWQSNLNDMQRFLLDYQEQAAA